MPPNGATLAVDLSALRANYRLLMARHVGNHIAAVVKANAYGLGVEAVSQALWQEGCREFFVATLEEALDLREHLPQAMIGVFSGVRAGEISLFEEHALTPVLNTLEQWQIVASGKWQVASLILHVDTGMTRLGLSEPDVHKLVEKNWRLPTADCRLTLMTHLACANEPVHPKNSEQLERFRAACGHFPNCRTSIANSSGLFLDTAFHGDLGRPGCALYGINPVEGENPMRHAATLSAPILQIRTLDRDETVGYGATYAAKKGSRIAIVGAGYADGVLRALSNLGSAYVAGQKVSFAGRVSMDMIALDVSAIPESRLGPESRAELINAAQPVSVVADAAGTIGYELLTRIGIRVKRLYYND